jgi:OOP family OmpA-OmpF porin
MKNMFFAPTLKISALIGLLATTGCAEYHKRVLHNTCERGPEFTRELAKEYGGLGVTEQTIMYDEASANYYYCKAIQAKEGYPVGPTRLEQWDIDPERMPEFCEARARLLTALQFGARQIAPKMTAHTQAHFDCWVEQQSEGWQKEDIALCRAEFYTGMAEVEYILMGGDARIPNQSIFFDLNSAHIPSEGLVVLDELVYAMNVTKTLEHIVLIGRTDRVGDSKHNKELSNHRAIAVKNELIHKGVPEHLITIRSAGETPGPQVDMHNRRVDIIFLPTKSKPAAKPADKGQTPAPKKP